MKKTNKYLITIGILIVIIAIGGAYIIGINSAKTSNVKTEKVTHKKNNKDNKNKSHKNLDTQKVTNKESISNANNTNTNSGTPSSDNSKSTETTSTTDPKYIANHYPENSPEYQEEMKREQNDTSSISSVTNGTVDNPVLWQQRQKAVTDYNGPTADNGLAQVN